MGLTWGEELRTRSSGGDSRVRSEDRSHGIVEQSVGVGNVAMEGNQTQDKYQIVKFSLYYFQSLVISLLF